MDSFEEFVKQPLTEREQELYGQYLENMHAMQSAVMYKMQIDPKDTEPKHLRVGINSSMIDTSALVYLLIEKGVFTREEWFEALVVLSQHEVDMYETAFAPIKFK